MAYFSLFWFAIFYIWFGKCKIASDSNVTKAIDHLWWEERESYILVYRIFESKIGLQKSNLYSCYEDHAKNFVSKAENTSIQICSNHYTNMSESNTLVVYIESAWMDNVHTSRQWLRLWYLVLHRFQTRHLQKKYFPFNPSFEQTHLISTA